MPLNKKTKSNQLNVAATNNQMVHRKRICNKLSHYIGKDAGAAQKVLAWHLLFPTFS